MKTLRIIGTILFAVLVGTAPARATTVIAWPSPAEAQENPPWHTNVPWLQMVGPFSAAPNIPGTIGFNTSANQFEGCYNNGVYSAIGGGTWGSITGTGPQTPPSSGWSGNMLPSVDATDNLGSGSYRWQNGQFSGTVTATTFVGALTGTASGNLVAGGALGTPASGTLTNCTGLPIAGGGTGAATAANALANLGAAAAINLLPSSGSYSGVTVTGTNSNASASMSFGTMVYQSGYSSGYQFKTADNSVPTQAAMAVCVNSSPISSSGTGTFLLSGAYTLSSGSYSPGPIYLSTSGSIAQTKPSTYSQQLGSAENSTSIIFNPAPNYESASMCVDYTFTGGSGTVTPSYTPSGNASTVDTCNIGNSASPITGTITMANPTSATGSGSPGDGQRLTLVLFDNGTARTISGSGTWTSGYATGTVPSSTFPTATNGSATFSMKIQLRYYTNTGKWEYIGNSY